ncbi:MAG: class I SAM-dependent methyltransferase [Candidatus Hodarchaeales archaeon]
MDIPKRFFDIISPLYDFIIRGDPTSNILEAIALTGKEMVLEIGTGTGRSISSLIDLASKIWILDPSLPMLRQAKEKFPSVKPVLGYAEKLPFDTLRFDRIIVIDSLHHWDNQLQGLREIERVLEPNEGLAIIVEFDPSKLLGHYIKSMEKFFMMGSKFFTPLELRKLHKKAGLQVIRQAYVEAGTYITVSRKDRI